MNKKQKVTLAATIVAIVCGGTFYGQHEKENSSHDKTISHAEHIRKNSEINQPNEISQPINHVEHSDIKTDIKTDIKIDNNKSALSVKNTKKINEKENIVTHKNVAHDLHTIPHTNKKNIIATADVKKSKIVTIKKNAHHQNNIKQPSLLKIDNSKKAIIAKQVIDVHSKKIVKKTENTNISKSIFIKTKHSENAEKTLNIKNYLDNSTLQKNEYKISYSFGATAANIKNVNLYGAGLTWSLKKNDSLFSPLFSFNYLHGKKNDKTISSHLNYYEFNLGLMYQLTDDFRFYPMVGYTFGNEVIKSNDNKHFRKHNHGDYLSYGIGGQYDISKDHNMYVEFNASTLKSLSDSKNFYLGVGYRF